ncbi:MAG: urea ABC transporter ATP-binding subunit UrtE [Candidatus Competibacteraceae bacterium]|nr:urea ABC transporter ATP-binding subunit UrtE [Candidatus Competibacteraceae bacterium]
MLTVQSVNQFYGESHILWDMSLQVPSGSCTCLMGRNGVGKTTLLKAIMGLLPIRNGSIQLQHTDLPRLPAHQRAQLGIGYVPQGRDIFPQLTVEENLLVALSTRRDKVRQIPARIFELFPVLKSMLGRRGGDLSGGQQQQLAIGRALALDPKLLILDEPTEGIQPNIVQEIGQVIQRLNREENLTVLLVEQKLPFARRYASNFCIMEKGRAVANGAIDQLNDTLVQQHLAV